MKIALLGHMGRDEALADKLQKQGHTLYILGQWRNPGLVEKAQESGGQFQTTADINNVRSVADFVQNVKPSIFVTNFDSSLAAGVVDAVLERNIPNLYIPCPDRAASRLEWDKFYLRQLVDTIDSSFNPINFMAEDNDAVHSAITYFKSQELEVAIKPRNLTGGKGVKVMGKHLESLATAEAYAIQVLSSPNQTGVEIQEKMVGHEFTLQLLTDGVTIIRPPATYDYPYREDGDTGPGTGGMGSFSMAADTNLPFVTNNDYDQAITLMQSLLQKLQAEKISYKGILYPTFFKTPQGLKIVEVNARGGDPELINIIDLMEDSVDIAHVLAVIAKGTLRSQDVEYSPLASAMQYLVSPEYGYKKGAVHAFGTNLQTIAETDCRVRFAAAEKVGDGKYVTVGSSRTVGLSALGKTPWEARAKIHEAIEQGFSKPLRLEYRKDVASEAYIAALKT